MHQRIATSKTYRNHKAYREKDFYSICSLDEYYYRHADLFQYDIHITNALSVIPNEKLVVVSQETMARGIDVVAQTIKHFARGDTPSTILEDLCASQTHTSYADKANEI